MSWVFSLSLYLPVTMFLSTVAVGLSKIVGEGRAIQIPVPLGSRISITEDGFVPCGQGFFGAWYWSSSLNKCGNCFCTKSCGESLFLRLILHTCCLPYASSTLTSFANKEGGRLLRLCWLN